MLRRYPRGLRMPKPRTFSRKLREWAVQDWAERETREANGEGVIYLAEDGNARACDICAYIIGERTYSYFRIYSKIDAHIFPICPKHAREAGLIW